MTKPTPSDMAVVLDAFSRMVVGWSIADHMPAELVLDAPQMAAWRRRRQPAERWLTPITDPSPGSRAFGRRLRSAGLASMGSVGDCFDNSVAESFFGTLQLELLDQARWSTRHELALAVFEWIEACTTPAAATPTAPCSAPPLTRPNTGRAASSRQHEPRRPRTQLLRSRGRPLGRRG